MTSTTTPPHGADAPPLGLVDTTAPMESDDHRGSGPRRRRSRFPGPVATAPFTPDGAPSPVRWIGSDEVLREHVRDHATAAGLDLVTGPSDLGATCLVLDSAALAHGERPVLAGRIPLLVVTADVDVPAVLWKGALAVGAVAVIPLPGGSEELLSQFAELSRPRTASTLIGVAGGCGGAGASSFAARLAAAARPHGPVVLVDADPCGGGLDLLVEETGASGIAWADTTGLGPDDGEALREGLPSVDEVSLLVARGDLDPDPQSLSRVLSALSPLGGTVIVDLADVMVPAAAEHADQILLVVPASDHAVRAASRRLRTWHLPDALAQAVVRRSGPLSPAEVARDLAIPLAASFRDSRRGTVPLLDVRRRGGDRAARQLMARLHAEPRT